VAAAVAAFLLGGLIASQAGDDGGPVADPAACKKALAVNYRKAMADPNAPSASAPSACARLDRATLERITGEVVSAYLDSATPATAPSPRATGKAACRAAIKAQYVPGTAKLKGAPSTPAECAGLSTDEVSKIALEVVSENTR